MRRRKKKIKPFWKAVIIFKLSVLILAGLGYVVLNSNFLKVQSLSFLGSDYYNENILRASILTQVLEEKKFLAVLGSNNILFWIFADDKGTINVNRKTLYLDKITVKTNPLKREVKINMEEKDVFGVICDKEENCFAFDNQGLIFSQAPSVKGSLIMRIDELTGDQIIIGEKVFSREEWTENVFTIFLNVKNNGFNPSSVTIKPAELREFSITMSSGLVFHFSLEFVPEDFNNVLKAVNRKLEIENINYIDFKVPDRIYYQ
ncbi:MAG: hypothetical protein WDZ80_06010 [Candidatus Paceibacterota bacterium]